MTIDHDVSDNFHQTPSSYLHKGRKWVAFPVLILVLGIGVAGGAGAMKLAQAKPEMAPMNPVNITSMPEASLVTIKGRVLDIYGNKFILQDDTGKTLIETGPAGDNGDLVRKDETVTIQGRFDNGFVHASYLIDDSGKTQSLHPSGPPIPHKIRDIAHELMH